MNQVVEVKRPVVLVALATILLVMLILPVAGFDKAQSVRLSD